MTKSIPQRLPVNCVECTVGTLEEVSGCEGEHKTALEQVMVDQIEII